MHRRALPNLEPETVEELKSRLATNFGEANVVVTPSEKGDAASVEIILPDRKINNRVRVQPPGMEEGDQGPLVPFPVSLPEDPDLLRLA